MVVVTFQSTLVSKYIKMIFFIFFFKKNQRIKMIKKHIKILFINKKKLNILKIQIQPYFQTLTIRLVIGIAGPY
jgi:hypothetical protein